MTDETTADAVVDGTTEVGMFNRALVECSSSSSTIVLLVRVRMSNSE